jgi:hypothetical protein
VNNAVFALHGVKVGPEQERLTPLAHRKRRNTVIEISRALVRHVRSLLRKSISTGMGRGQRPAVRLQAGRDGLHLRSQQSEVALEYHLPGVLTPETFTLPGEALDDFEGRREQDLVSLEGVGTEAVLARWEDGGVPQVREYPSPDKDRVPSFPEEPRKLSPIDNGILKVLDDAAQTAAKEGVRFAVQKLQLRGGKGDIVATDGRQLLIQGNFALPWKDDVLIPAVSLFGCRELPQDVPVAIGKTDKHVCIRVGPWTFFLSIDTASRFPTVESVIPRATGTVTTCHLSPEDAAFLLKALPRLPGREVDNAPLTLDLNGQVTVRAKGEDSSRITEVVLAHSTVTGPAVRLVGNRQLFARAVQLGFTEFRIIKPDVPLVSSDKYRTFVWMPLDKEGALPSSEDALRITSGGDEPAISQPKKERSNETMTKPSTNGQSNGPTPSRHNDDEHATTGSGLGALIAEAQSLKEVLHDAYGRTNRLLIALKRQRKQSRLMQTTLASLKQLQQIEG